MNRVLVASGAVIVLGAAGTTSRSDFCLLRDFQSVIHFNAKVSHRRFKLGMAKQQLDGAQLFFGLNAVLLFVPWFA